MIVPTKLVGSIPRPQALLEAVRRAGGADRPSFGLYDADHPSTYV